MKTSPFNIRLLLSAALLHMALGAARAHELKGLELVGDGSGAHIKLVFDRGGSPGEYPAYFQKTGGDGTVLTTSFLKTGSAFPLGKYRPAPNAWVREIALKRYTSPSGKIFLGVELKLAEPWSEKTSPQPGGKGVLKLPLNAKPAGKFLWSLQKPPAAKPAQAAKTALATSDGAAKPAQDPKPAPAKKTVVETKSASAVRPGQAELRLSEPSAGEGKPGMSQPPHPDWAEGVAAEKRTAEEERQRLEPEAERVAYNSYGRRDPFIPVEEGSSGVGIDVDRVKLVGIVWRDAQSMAVLEHTAEIGVSYTVRQGDPVHNGRVSRITRDAVTFDISEYGISRSYTLKLISSRERTQK